MSKTYIVFGKELRYEPDGTLWFCKSGSGVKLGKPVGSKTPCGYRQCTLGGVQKKVHHVVWYIHKGYWPKNLDHINKNKSDNRVENLREGVSVNNHNRNMPLPSSNVVGAHWVKRKKKYKSQICVNKKRIHLGYFNCPTAASIAYHLEKQKVLNV